VTRDSLSPATQDLNTVSRWRAGGLARQTNVAVCSRLGRSTLFFPLDKLTESSHLFCLSRDLTIVDTNSNRSERSNATFCPRRYNSAFQQRHLYASQRRRFNNKSNNNWQQDYHVFDTTTRSIDRLGSPLQKNLRYLCRCPISSRCHQIIFTRNKATLQCCHY
jgi:hypothetical protein